MLVAVSPDSSLADNSAQGLPDAFGASLLNPDTASPLVPTVYPMTTDSFYIRDVVDGVTQGLAAPGVTVSSAPGALALVSVDISSLLAGQTAEIFFRLVGGTDPSSSSTMLSDVTVTGAIAVPEPSTFLLAYLGMVCLASGRRLLQSGRHAGDRATMT
jgi:hypothetical protein